MARAQFIVLLSCSHCLAMGAAVWEENTHTSATGPERRLVALHGDFRVEAGHTQSGDPRIVCDSCKTPQPD